MRKIGDVKFLYPYGRTKLKNILKGLLRVIINRAIKRCVCLVLFICFMLPANQLFAEGNQVISSESFESGSFNESNFLPGSGVITNDSDKVVSGTYSAYLNSSTAEEWKEFAYTDQKKVRFEKNTTYNVKFSYKSVSMEQSNSDRYFYFLARSNDNAEDKGWTVWKNQSGSQGSQSVTFRTGNKDNYYLIWGIHNGGALSLDDIHIVKSSESFEKGTFSNTDFLAGSGIITSNSSQIVSGNYSAFLKSSTVEEWKEFSYTDLNKVKFEKNTTYSVTFNFKSVDMLHTDSNRFFYFLARSMDNTEDKGWTTWNNSSGFKGSQTITFTTGNKENYYLIWGIHGGGALAIDDIQIVKASESFERGTYNDTKYKPLFGMITSDPEKVVSGSYSAYLTSPPFQEWKDFIISDLDKVKFEKNTSYKVTFSYKSLET